MFILWWLFFLSYGWCVEVFLKSDVIFVVGGDECWGEGGVEYKCFVYEGFILVKEGKM